LGIKDPTIAIGYKRSNNGIGIKEWSSTMSNIGKLVFLTAWGS
jgi:hypothetical protein